MAPFLKIAVNEVHIWQIDQKNCSLYFRDEARLALCQILASYLQTDVQKIVLIRTPNAKPFLQINDSIYPNLEFSLSHTGNKALCAITQNIKVGIDIELIRVIQKPLKLAQRFFTQEECQFLAKHQDDKQSFYFLRIWTAKEAFMKALGQRLLSGTLRHFATFPSFCAPVYHLKINQSKLHFHHLSSQIITLQTPWPFMAALATLSPVKESILPLFFHYGAMEKQ